MNRKSLKSYGEKSDKAMKTVMRLVRVAHILNNKTELFLSKYTLTFNQFKVLEVLYHRGNLNISSITKLIMGTPGNTTVIVRNLIRDELIESKKASNDNRSSILSITPKGVAIIEDIFPSHSNNLNEFLDVLDDNELKTLFDLLDKIYNKNKKD
ncbi:MarR family transcriptional regulator [Aliarcobacter trophiarum LMG 25534]|uniref:MarR family transcriptional regulator n=1 Tax=Aliarcobacter trophiarum LMG 25534 TaxID=1032241 RepID=A0AAD0QHM7_9BACT|nr:MarR family transcriptional regulator [Aliarcobacter trophiarum]AXK48012.1 transcriptional regulator, MarR family [Aliarcobacter trophiarum LMG 25534]RXJ90043.1 MarR family transcriptional regulator [Aliarcobacter trophiarum LMG 25534]